jgi:radical SAM superfamily enzyme YgiQ (UPF0313 family)
MKLTLIKPNIGRMQGSLFVDGARMEPLSLAVIAGLTPPDIEVVLLDDLYEEIPYDDPTDLVAITVQTFTAKRAYEISAAYRARGVRVVLGGFHPSLVPGEASKYADAIVIGDAETVWAEVIEDARLGKLRQVYTARPCDRPQSGILARRDIFKGKDYLPITPVQFSRGCKYACTFCAINAYFGQRHTTRPVNEVVREIEQQERKLIAFVDDNIIADRDAAKELFRSLIPLRIRWASQASLDMVQDRELLDLMVESGCIGTLTGFESINPDALRELKKAPNLRSFDRYEREVELLKDYGLLTFAFFIMGLDADTPQSLYETLDFARRCKFTFAGFMVLTPYPSTPLYEKLDKEGRLLYDGKWWLHPDYRFNHAAFQPARMTADELTQIAFDIRSRWSSFGSILARSLEPRTNMRSIFNLLAYWKYNPLFRSEGRKKQGLFLGRS